MTIVDSLHPFLQASVLKVLSECILYRIILIENNNLQRFSRLITLTAIFSIFNAFWNHGSIGSSHSIKII